MNRESVKPGQTWVSNDRRDAGIEFAIIRIDGDYAICEKTNGRVTRIRVDRFKLTATGYRLVKDVGGANQPRRGVREMAENEMESKRRKAANNPRAKFTSNFP